MNQRHDPPGGEQERGRETNGGREYTGGEGFDDVNVRAYGGGESSGRERSAGQQSPQGQYERDSYAYRSAEPREHWHGGFERSPSYRSREGAASYGQGPRRDWGGTGQGHSESDRYRPVTEEWEAARGYGDMGREEPRYGQQERYGEGRYSEGRFGGQGHGGYGERAGRGQYGGEGRWGRGSEGGQWGEGRYGGGEGRSDQGGWRGASQPNYGGRSYWGDRPSWRDQYGFSRRYRQRGGGFPRDEYGREHSSEQLFEREPFGHRDEPHYYGTGAPGWGGPGFTGGGYAYGDATRYQQRPIESEYSDESSVGYEGQYGRGYSRGGGSRSGVLRIGGGRQYARGPKGYQRSDERLKEDISERLMEAYDIDSSEVTVEVQGAKVILEGTVPSRHMKHTIEDLVDACPGVQDIENKVRVASPNYQGSAGGAAGSGMSTGSGTAASSSATTGSTAPGSTRAGAQSTGTQSTMGSQPNSTRTKQ